MSPRPIRVRRIENVPSVKGFKPFGSGIKQNEKPVFLLQEEYEAIRLCDHEMLSQKEASDTMKVSRPTLSRIYTSARRKISMAFVEAREIIIEGGKVYFDSEWFECKSCSCFFNNPRNNFPEYCALCGSPEVIQVEEENS